MKKVFAIAAALMLLGTTAFAQSFSAGYVQSTANNNGTNGVANGFYAGVGYTAQIAPGLNLNPGLYYELLTSSSAASAIIATNNSKTTEHYLNVPFHVSYGFDLAPTFRLSVFAGPTANFGIASKTHSSTNVVIVGNVTNDTDNYASGNYGRFDIMVGGGVCAELSKKIRIVGGYDLGLMDRNTTDNGTYKRTRFYVGAAYVL
ncbi:MAG: PorT family protein [Bacteroidales bacterium]|nr:PorT family protein [Bacteroidales bacterium]